MSHIYEKGSSKVESIIFMQVKAQFIDTDKRLPQPL